MVGVIEGTLKSSLAKEKRRKSRELLTQEEFGRIQQGFPKGCILSYSMG